ncbi:MAG: hypothetical protein IIB25_08540, partial [Chloroflexi bacterium]|nr:hypothetical protein [Chloroflexota bacterium]
GPPATGNLPATSVRQGDWKLIRFYGDAPGQKDRLELYDLAADIGESQNVAKDHPEVVARLRRIADEMDDDLGTTGIGPGCRPLGKVENARPLIDHDGKVREGFSTLLPVAGMGIMVGEVTATSALAQVRLTKTDSLVAGDVPGMAGVVRFQLEPVYPTTKKPQRSRPLPATAERDFIVRQLFEQLKPGAEYRIRTWIVSHAAALRDGPTATFRTANERET